MHAVALIVTTKLKNERPQVRVQLIWGRFWLPTVDWSAGDWLETVAFKISGPWSNDIVMRAALASLISASAGGGVNQLFPGTSYDGQPGTDLLMKNKNFLKMNVTPCIYADVLLPLQIKIKT